MDSHVHSSFDHPIITFELPNKSLLSLCYRVDKTSNNFLNLLPINVMFTLRCSFPTSLLKKNWKQRGIFMVCVYNRLSIYELQIVKLNI
jgi:hypothetical protein